MKVIIEEVSSIDSPFFKVYLVEDSGEIGFLKVFSFKYGEDEVSIFNREKNYNQALAYVKSLEEFLQSGIPKTKILYENEIHSKEN